jgi:hypothetical protein
VRDGITGKKKRNWGWTHVNLFRSPLASILDQCNFEIQEEPISQPKRLINHPTQKGKIHNVYQSHFRSGLGRPRNMAPFVAKCPRLLPGESEEDYHALFHVMILEIEPQTAVEWLVMADITGLCWEINRYRGWKGAILNTYRTQAIEAALRAAHDSGAIVDGRRPREEGSRGMAHGFGKARGHQRTPCRAWL